MRRYMHGTAASVNEVKGLIVQMFEKLRFLENTIQISSAVNHTLNTFIEDILVAGGKDNDNNPLKSVERFSWKKNVWERMSSMNVGRIGPTSFVYENQVFVAGGCDSPVVEVLDLNQDLLQWVATLVKVPYLCGLRSVVYQNRAVLFTADGETHYCAELCLVAPYTCKQLCEMPGPPRGNYTVVAFEHKVLIFGGQSGSEDNVLDSVLQFDISTNQFKVMPPLPWAVSNLASVRWEDQAVLIGGFSNDQYLEKILMCDSKTGNTTELPSMLEGRSACAAVITSNTIVVMGGRGDRLVVSDLLKPSLWVVLLGDIFLP